MLELRSIKQRGSWCWGWYLAPLIDMVYCPPLLRFEPTMGCSWYCCLSFSVRFMVLLLLWTMFSFQARLDIIEELISMSSVTILLLGCLRLMSMFPTFELSTLMSSCSLWWFLLKCTRCTMTDIATTATITTVRVPRKRTLTVCGDRQVRSPVSRLPRWKVSMGLLFVWHLMLSGLRSWARDFKVQLQSCCGLKTGLHLLLCCKDLLNNLQWNVL